MDAVNAIALTLRMTGPAEQPLPAVLTLGILRMSRNIVLHSLKVLYESEIILATFACDPINCG